MMEIFVNECSLHEQFHDKAELERAFQQFYTALNIFSRYKAEHTLYYDQANFFHVYRVHSSEIFIASLNALSKKDLRQAIINTFYNKLNARDWRQEQRHSENDIFICFEDVVTDISMAELAERRLQNTNLIGLLINFPQSKFKNQLNVIITKNEIDSSTIDCVDEKSVLERWLDNTLQTALFVYDYTSITPPTDLQTVLRSKSRFIATPLNFQGRKIYREHETNCYWYVDNLHYGYAAHLEVFDSRGQHIGEANPDGAVDTDKKDPTKRLNM